MKNMILIITVLVSSNFFSQQTGTFTDKRDGKTYKTIQIGNQVWMAEGLKTTKLNNGSQIRQVRNAEEWLESIEYKSPAYMINNVTNEFLYNYYAVQEMKGLSPLLFSIPTMEDFIQLGINCGGKRNFMVRNDGEQFDWIEGVSSSLRNQFWGNPGKNSFAFNANRTGMVQYSGEIDHNNISHFWTTNGHISLTDKKNTEYSYDEYLSGMKGLFPSNKESYKLFLKSMNSDNLFISSGSYYDQGYSIRCIKSN
jgi:uncharacterized protein (TIGR02145 family)